MMDELKRYRRKSSLRLWKAYLEGELDEEFRRINRESMRMYREEIRAIDREDQAAPRKPSTHI